MYFSLLTTLLSSCLSISVNNHLTNELVEEPTDKIIYIDVSLNNLLKDNAFNLRYNDGTETKTVELISDNNDIYHASLPLDLLDKDTSYFELYSETEYVTEHISNSVLKENNYNYVCISDDTTVKGYGYYGNSVVNPGATYRTQRVWLINDNDEYYSNDDWGTACITVH